ncbi:MAG: GNAT family N-acetyltransferase [Bdellovibrionota bacterium]
MNISIRKALDKDIPFVLNLIAQADMSPDNTLSPAQATELFHNIERTGCHTIYVAESANEVIGTFALVVIQQLSHSGARSMIIEDVVVRSDLQGQGIGQQMMRFATDQAKALGCYKVCLSSGTARIKAHEFYEQMGFKKDGYRFALPLKS